MKYSHFARVPDPGVYRRKLSPESAERVRLMRGSGMSLSAIAAWFTRNGTPITYKTVKRALEREAA